MAVLVGAATESALIHNVSAQSFRPPTPLCLACTLFTHVGTMGQNPLANCSAVDVSCYSVVVSEKVGARNSKCDTRRANGRQLVETGHANNLESDQVVLRRVDG